MDKQTEKGFKRYSSYQPSRTGILLIDPYNDFLHPDGKAYFKSKEVIEGVNLLNNMARVIQAARDLKIQIYYVPHHHSEPGDFANWKYPNALQLATAERQVFAKGS